jgi:uncharacterized membrane protein YfcA
MENGTVKSPEILDKAAVALSGLCVLHCLALPFVIVLLPFLNEIAIHQWHAPMLLVVIPVSVFAFTIGYRRHANSGVIETGAVGMLFMVIGGTLAHYLLGLTADRILTIFGAVVLAAAHYRNSRLSRHCGPRTSPRRSP